MTLNFFQIAMFFFIFIGIGFNSLFLVSVTFAALYIKQQMEIKKIKSSMLFEMNQDKEKHQEHQEPKQEEHHKLEQEQEEASQDSLQNKNNHEDFNEKIKENQDVYKKSNQINKSQWLHSKYVKPKWKESELANKSKELLNKIFDFVSGVDLITKVGSLIFLMGIGFLIKYTSTFFEITSDIKIGGGVLIGSVVFGLGFKLFGKHPRYGATLEGLGLGITYLSIYLGFILYSLYSINFTLITMIAISSFMIFISLKQDKEILSGIAFLGAFLAPLLAYSETGNILLLTTYFLLINVSILCIVFYKNWTIIVIEGFLLTFSILSLWFLMNGFDDNVNCLYPLTAILMIYIYIPLRILDKDH